jgi:hypothetical protein
MTTSEDAYSSGSKYSLEEFVAKLQGYIDQKSSEDGVRSDCALVVTDAGLDLCCTIDTDDGLEVQCIDVLKILKPE